MTSAPSGSSFGRYFQTDVEVIRRLFRDQLITWTEARDQLRRAGLALREDDEILDIPSLPQLVNANGGPNDGDESPAGTDDITDEFD